MVCRTRLFFLDSCCAVTSVTLSTMSVASAQPYVRVRAQRPSRVLVQHSYSREDAFTLHVSAVSAYHAAANATGAANISVSGGINVTIIDVEEFARTGDAVLISLEPHSGSTQLLRTHISCLSQSFSHAKRTKPVLNTSPNTHYISFRFWNPLSVVIW